MDEVEVIEKKETEPIKESERVIVNTDTDEFYHLFMRNKHKDNIIYNDKMKFAIEI